VTLLLGFISSLPGYLKSSTCLWLIGFIIAIVVMLSGTKIWYLIALLKSISYWMVPDFVSSLLFFIYLIVKVPMLMHCELFVQGMDNIKLRSWLLHIYCIWFYDKVCCLICSLNHNSEYTFPFVFVLLDILLLFCYWLNCRKNEVAM